MKNSGTCAAGKAKLRFICRTSNIQTTPPLPVTAVRLITLKEPLKP
jgi:hypothetical protein